MSLSFSLASLSLEDDDHAVESSVAGRDNNDLPALDSLFVVNSSKRPPIGGGQTEAAVRGFCIKKKVTTSEKTKK